MFCLWFHVCNEIVTNLFVFLVHWSPYGLHEWCFQWILKFVEWDFEYGGAWMDFWFEHRCGKLKLLHWWGFHPNVLSLPWLCILCSCHLSSFLIDNQWCAKVVFSNNNKGLWWAWETFPYSRCFKVGLPTILVEIIMWGDQVLVHLVVLKDFYCHLKKLGSTQTWISFIIIDEETLDVQCLFEKIIMIFNPQWAMDQPLNLNPLFQLWKELSPNALLCVHLSEFMEVVELVLVQIMGFVEDERNFLTVTFMKTWLQNMILEHDLWAFVNMIWIWWFYVCATFLHYG